MSYKIVVARCYENVDWLIYDSDNTIIYNKGDKLDLPNEVHLENVGREADTYLNYIIDNYYNLPDVVIFTQGKIFDHIEGNSYSFLMKMKEEAFMHGKSIPILIHHQHPNGDSSSWVSHWNVYPDHFFMHDNYKNDERLPFIDWFTPFDI